MEIQCGRLGTFKFFIVFTRQIGHDEKLQEKIILGKLMLLRLRDFSICIVCPHQMACCLRKALGQMALDC